MPDTRRKTGPTPKAPRRREFLGRVWDLPETATQRERIVAQQGGGRARAAALFAGVPSVTVLHIQADEGVLPQGTRSRRRAERQAAR